MSEKKTLQSLLKNVCKAGDASLNRLKNLKAKVEMESHGSQAQGMSFLELKNEMLLSYLLNLSHLMMTKLQGNSLLDAPAKDDVMRLVELRTVLERMNPLEQKLQYQIGKLMQVAVTGSRAADDPHQFRARPGNLASQLEEAGSEEEGDEGKEDEKPQLYVPQKHTPMPYDEEPEHVKAEKRGQTARKRALAAQLLDDLREQHSSAPSEIREGGAMHRMVNDKELKHREDYEEDAFVRLSVTKKEANRLKRLRTEGTLKQLTRFDDIPGLSSHSEGPPKKKSKGKKTFKGKDKKGKGKKKRFRK